MSKIIYGHAVPDHLGGGFWHPGREEGCPKCPPQSCECRSCGCDNASANPVNAAGICTACQTGDHLECDPDCDHPQHRENTVTENEVRYGKPRSWAPQVLVDGKWAGNGLRFATQDEAERSGRELLTRWFVPTDSRAVPSSDEVNYRLDENDHPHFIEEARKP